MRSIIKFNEKAWLKPYIDMNTDLRRKEKMFLKKMLLNNAIIGKTMENMRKHRNIKLVAINKLDRKTYIIITDTYIEKR